VRVRCPGGLRPGAVCVCGGSAWHFTAISAFGRGFEYHHGHAVRADALSAQARDFSAPTRPACPGYRGLRRRFAANREKPTVNRPRSICG